LAHNKKKKLDVNDYSIAHLTLILLLHYLRNCDRQMDYRHMHFWQSPFLANSTPDPVSCKFLFLQIPFLANSHRCQLWGLSTFRGVPLFDVCMRRPLWTLGVGT